MKKILCLAMVLALALSVSAVSMAAEAHKTFYVSEFDTTIDEENIMGTSGDDLTFGDSIFGKVTVVNGKSKDALDPSSPSAFLNDPEDADSFKVSASWEQGGEYIKDVKLSKKLFKSAPGEEAKAQYLIEISTKEAPSETEAKDVIGTVTVKSKDFVFYKGIPAPGFDGKGEKEVNADVAFTLSNEEGILGTTTDKAMVYSFGKGEEEQEISLFADMGNFTVDTRGQDALVLEADVFYNKGIEAISADNAYVYFNGNGATFNKIGTLLLKSDAGNYLYRVNSDGTLKENKAPYDEEEEAFKIRTRVLGSYVISERKLDLESINSKIDRDREALGATSIKARESEESEGELFIPSNPSTGARN